MATLTLEHVAMEGRPYPTHLLEGCETGLVLFAAAFLGHNDAVHFAEAGIRTTCVDIDTDRLTQMEALYPDDWQFMSGDAWEFADAAYVRGKKWDAVSADTFTGDAMHQSLDSLSLWCVLARRVVTVTITGDAIGDNVIPEGWKHSYYTRSGSVHWLVLTRA